MVSTAIAVIIYCFSFIFDMIVYQKYIRKTGGKKKEAEYHDFWVIMILQMLLEIILEFRFLLLPSLIVPRLVRLGLALTCYQYYVGNLFTIDFHPFEITLDPAWSFVVLICIMWETALSIWFYAQMAKGQ